jgi:hypothetical protein
MRIFTVTGRGLASTMPATKRAILIGFRSRAAPSPRLVASEWAADSRERLLTRPNYLARQPRRCLLALSHKLQENIIRCVR